jgi:two-component system phosphate regulon sensor histidine kinase PhoR
LGAFAIVIIGATITLDFTVRRSWEDWLLQEIQRNLTEKTLMFANRVNADREQNLQIVVSQAAHAAGTRATVIDATGKVLADSEADPSTLENHASRPEFVSALQGQVGTDKRLSESLSIPFLYVAAPVQGGAVRLAYPLTEVEGRISHVRRMLFVGSVITFFVAMLIAAIAALSISRRLRRIVTFAERIAAGDLTARIEEPSVDEIGQVASALDKTARQFEASFVALQNSQRQLETLLNSMQDAVIAIGADERVQWANRSMDRLQKTRLQSPVEETVRDPDFLRAIRGAGPAKKVFTARSTSILPGRTFDVTAAPMPGGGAVAVLRDLTENERVEKTRRDFIANVSHELRTPLTSIQGYAETLLDGSSDGNHARDFLEIIRKNASRMSRLTEDLLTLARVESGETRFDTESVIPGELLHDAVESFEERARTQGTELQVEDSTQRLVRADREAIHQVFSNLVDNALKYGATGQKLVLGARDSARGVEFYVQDFGPGIPSEHLLRLFERFYRVDKARSRESGGTGLGLAIAKHIVLAHGGTIRAESELNHGSTFLFTLPAAAEVQPAAS